ncbi:hypothetical protein SAM9427_32775 [Streptomyces sp. ETH9427]|nr:hypothetical protein SAM9427_32775 [Streptomyces sp. ETH9427]
MVCLGGRRSAVGGRRSAVGGRRSAARGSRRAARDACPGRSPGPSSPRVQGPTVHGADPGSERQGAAPCRSDPPCRGRWTEQGARRGRAAARSGPGRSQ